MATIAVLGTLDTRGEEHAYLRDCIQAKGHDTILIDVGTGGPPQVEPDLSRELVAAVSGADLVGALQRDDRDECIALMTAAAPALTRQLYTDRKIDGILSLGGAGGTTVCLAAMQILPVGFPKLMISTMAGHDPAPDIGHKDILVYPSVLATRGLNAISRMILSRAVGAISGMVETHIPATENDPPLIAASILDRTADCVNTARDIIEAAGYEVLDFPADGTGGQRMEALVASDLIAGVLDITTGELASELLGGNEGAGPSRLAAAAQSRIPAVVVPGGLDVAHFGARATVPSKYTQRTFYTPHPDATLMRTSPEECEQLGKAFAEKINAYQGPIAVLLPTKSTSALSAEGEALYAPTADLSLFDAIKSNLRADIPLQELDRDINDPDFALACAVDLLDLLKQ